MVRWICEKSKLVRLAGLAAIVLCGTVFGAPAQAQDRRAGAALAAALEAVQKEDWVEAMQRARPAGALGQDLIEWHRLRAGQGSFADYTAFLRRHPDWPGLKLMRRKGEAAITAQTPPRQVLAYFADQGAQTGSGALRWASAYAASGDTGDAQAEIVLAWRSMSLTGTERAGFLAAYGDLLKPHHAARQDMLLWRGLVGEARAMAPLVGPDLAALAQARIGLRLDENGVDSLIKAVPARLQTDPGLAYERFAWRFRKGRNADAAKLMLERSATLEPLGEPARWANGRRQLARALMRDGQTDLAYRIASMHHLEKGSNFADLEWLSGYIALRYLKDPAKALAHFERFRQAVKSPISLGRAGYWTGRASEALRQPADARVAYEFGARYQTSFYGQLAAERAGLAMDPALTGQQAYPDWHKAAFMGSGVLKAARLLRAAGDTRLATRFMLQVAESLDPTELGQLADFALAGNDPHSALMIAKQAARRGVVLPRAYYPLHPLAKLDLAVAPELALSIARRESEFDPQVVSGVGARGLMQLMPRTAKAMSAALETDFDSKRLLSDWRYNARLGSAYLAKLQQEFGASPLLIAAGYNAGPSRARRWIAELGDPRTNAVDVVDWIEHIPFRETRNYVMRVAESVPVYRARLAGKPQPLRLLAELAER